MNILEGCRHNKVAHLVYARSSSVCGSNTKIPFSEHDNTDRPVSSYAATKKSHELMAHAYSYLYNFSPIGLRFFAGYDPSDRSNVAVYIFPRQYSKAVRWIPTTTAIWNAISLTIDDIVEGVVRVANKCPETNPKWIGEYPEPESSPAPYRRYNIGRHTPMKLLTMIEAMKSALRKKAVKNFLQKQSGIVLATYTEVSSLRGCLCTMALRMRVSGTEHLTPLIRWVRIRKVGVIIRVPRVFL
jgi:UDP-glucuronate 4-epimerase